MVCDDGQDDRWMEGEELVPSHCSEDRSPTCWGR